MTESHTDDALKRLRSELAELRAEVGTRDADARVTVLTVALAAVMLALTAAPWFWAEQDRGADQVVTAWGVPGSGFFGLLAVLLVLAAAGSTLVHAGFSAPTAKAHWTLCVLSLVCAGVVLFLPALIDEDVTSGSGLWLTVVAALVLCGMHGTHGDRLRARESWRG